MSISARIPKTPARPLTGRLALILAAVAMLAVPPTAVHAQRPSIADHTAGMTAIEGFFTLYWDDATGKMFWEIDNLGTGFIYQISMGSGLGSNPVNIDRGQLRGTYLLEPRRVGYRWRFRRSWPVN